MRMSVFDGGFMLGERALAYGLIDGFADLDGLVRELGGKRATAPCVSAAQARVARSAAAVGGRCDVGCGGGTTRAG